MRARRSKVTVYEPVHEKFMMRGVRFRDRELAQNLGTTEHVHDEESLIVMRGVRSSASCCIKTDMTQQGARCIAQLI
jgi:hypothetical protein